MHILKNFKVKKFVYIIHFNIDLSNSTEVGTYETL
jgi:hypothetical protein